MEPLISVIVPVYKVERYLDKCVQSIVDQTYQNLEIILVDDGSPDACPQMCEKWRRRDTRVKVIHQENCGLSEARNSGMKIASGEYICFVDSDDAVTPELCEKVMSIFEKHSVDVVTFDCERITEDGKKLGGTENINNRLLSSVEALEEMIRGNVCEFAWNKVYRAEVLKGIWFPKGRYFEDSAVMYQIFLRANLIYTLNEKLYFYLQRADSIAATMTAKKLNDLYYARRKRYDDLNKVYPDIAELGVLRVALSALRLYDRSLWEQDDMLVLEDAKEFLKEHRKRLLQERSYSIYKLYFYAPKLYDILRKGIHLLATILRVRKGRRI